MTELLTSFFLPSEDYQKLENSTKKLLQDYHVSDDQVKRSIITKTYWSAILGDEVTPCSIDEKGLVPIDNFSYDSKVAYTILRPKELLSEIFDHEKIAERILNCPVSTIDFYGGSTQGALEDRQSSISRETQRGFKALSKTVTYKLEDLEPIQLDYVNEFFTSIWQQIFDEQEEAYDEASFNNGCVPVNGLIGQFVTAMSFERHNDDCYLTFVYELFTRQGVNNSAEEEKIMKVDPEAEIPLEIEIMTVIPLAEDDDGELNPEDMEYITVDENGDHAVNFSVTAVKLEE